MLRLWLQIHIKPKGFVQDKFHPLPAKVCTGHWWTRPQTCRHASVCSINRTMCVSVLERAAHSSAKLWFILLYFLKWFHLKASKRPYHTNIFHVVRLFLFFPSLVIFLIMSWPLQMDPGPKNRNHYVSRQKCIFLKIVFVIKLNALFTCYQCSWLNKHLLFLQRWVRWFTHLRSDLVRSLIMTYAALTNSRKAETWEGKKESLLTSKSPKAN